MRKGHRRFVTVVLLLLSAVPAYVFASEGSAAKFSELLMKAPEANHWQVKADGVYGHMQPKKTDFVVVAVRPDPPGQKGGKIAGGQCTFPTMRY
jgi:hypothetical protein